MPSTVSATLVKMLFFWKLAMAIGFVLCDVPGATPTILHDAGKHNTATNQKILLRD
jgi:hypothetical protein